MRAVIIRQRCREFLRRRAADRFARFPAQSQGKPVDDVHPLAEQGRAAAQPGGHRGHGHQIARRRASGHTHTTRRHQRLGRTIEVDQVVVGKHFARFHRFGAPIAGRRDGSAPVDLRALDLIAEGIAWHAGSEGAAKAGARHNRGHDGRSGNGPVERPRVTPGGDTQNRARRQGRIDRTRGGGGRAQASKLRRSGPAPRGDGRRRDRDGGRRAGAVATAAAVDGNRCHHAARQHRSSGGRRAAAWWSDRDHRRGKVARAAATHGDGRDHSSRRDRGKATRTTMIEHVPHVALDLKLGLRARRQQHAESGEEQIKSCVHCVWKVRGWTVKCPLKK